MTGFRGPEEMMIFIDGNRIGTLVLIGQKFPSLVSSKDRYQARKKKRAKFSAPNSSQEFNVFNAFVQLH